MYNWNTNISGFKKNSDSFRIWRLNQLINFGLNGEKLDFKMLKKYWNRLDLDRKRKRFLSLLLWGKQS